MNRPSKARIRQSFERAAPTYDSAAAIQRAICHDLLAALPAGLAPARLVDAGCGTGYALPLLRQRYPAAEAFAVDLAPAMLHRVGAGCGRLAGDLEHLPLADASIDLYWSSLAVQWCDLARVLGEARRVLRPGGHLAIATLGPGTFAELRDAFAGVDDYRHTLAFHDAGEIRALAEAAGLSGIALEQSTKVAHYPDFRSQLKAVKAIGANQLGEGRRPHPLRRSELAAATAAAETRRTAEGLPLSYDIIRLTARP